MLLASPVAIPSSPNVCGQTKLCRRTVMAPVTLCSGDLVLIPYVRKIKPSCHGQVQQQDMRILTAVSSRFPVSLLEVTL